jgi:predicted phosphate transport protein (TIGR00153 family)
MFMRLFRSIMPHDELFIERFCEHSRNVVWGAECFRDMLSGDGMLEKHYAELCRFEEEADKVTRETITAIHRTFVTPFDRSQILDLITALDDTLDLMKEAGRRLRRYQLAFTPQMRGMADCAVRAATEIRDVMPALGKINRSVERFSTMQRQVRRAETEADDLLDAGLRELFEGSGSPGYKLTVEKVYDLIESVVDRCEDVADVLESIAVKNS